MCGQIWPSPGTQWHGLSSPSQTACCQQHLLETGAKGLLDQEPRDWFSLQLLLRVRQPLLRMRLHFRYPCSEGMVPGSCWRDPCSRSTPIKVASHVYITQCGGFFAHPRHSNLAERCRTKHKTSRWHPLPLRKSRDTTTSFFAMSCWLCPWHTWLPLTNPSSFWFSACSTALSFFPLFVFL